MLQGVLVVGMLVCAVQALRTPRLLASALWLAGTSALLALLLTLLGAPEVAIIELSVGAGLVTVLLVFAISVAGEEGLAPAAIPPRPLAAALVLLCALLLAILSYPLAAPLEQAAELPFARYLWEERLLDVLLQVMLIFAGTMGLLNLLGERTGKVDPAAAQPGAERAGNHATPEGARP